MQPFTPLRNGVMAPPIIAGTFGYNSLGELRNLVEDALDLGYKGFDTAPSYGNRQLLGQALSEAVESGLTTRDELFLIDKIDGWQMQDSGGKVTGHVEEALAKLRTDHLDLLLIHWPFPIFLWETWETFIGLLRRGVVRSIGFCNLELRHLDSLVERGVEMPHVLQIERHPLFAAKDEIAFCKHHGIAVQGYSPVCRMIPQIRDSPVLCKIASDCGRTVGQVIMRWHIQSGVAPVFMTKKRERLEEYVKAFDFQLDESQLETIDSMDQGFKLFLGSRACPGY